ncbi:MAG: hypothetical protein AAGC93_06095 [Cyanobacteria bacterium P01_F01_bin.53]
MKNRFLGFGLLALTAGLLPSALFPTTVKAASLSFGEPSAIALFRGAGGLLGSAASNAGTTGINNLASRINRDLADYALTTRVFTPYEGTVLNFNEVGSTQGTDFFNQLDDGTALGTIGYSAGGISAIRTAKNTAPKPIDLLVQIDSFEPLTGVSNEDEVLPDNVRKGINYYQERNRFNVFRPGFTPTDLQGATNVRGSENINVEERFGNRNITHRNIINNPSVQASIVEDIKNNLLGDRTFDRAGKLRLGDGASTTNNILRLTPRNNAAAEVRLADSLASNSSFQSKVTFRLPFETIAEGLSLWIGPEDGPSAQNLTLQFDPILPGESIQGNKIRLLTPGKDNDTKNAPFSFNDSAPITAWVEYDSETNQYSVFFNNTDNKPDNPFFTRTIDLAALGDRTYFGFSAAGSNDGQYADLLSFLIETPESFSSSLTANLIEADEVTKTAILEGSAIAPSQLALASAEQEYATLTPSFLSSSDVSAVATPEPGLLVGLGLFSGGLLLVKCKKNA